MSGKQPAKVPELRVPESIPEVSESIDLSPKTVDTQQQQIGDDLASQLQRLNIASSSTSKPRAQSNFPRAPSVGTHVNTNPSEDPETAQAPSQFDQVASQLSIILERLDRLEQPTANPLHALLSSAISQAASAASAMSHASNSPQQPERDMEKWIKRRSALLRHMPTFNGKSESSIRLYLESANDYLDAALVADDAERLDLLRWACTDSARDYVQSLRPKPRTFVELQDALLTRYGRSYEQLLNRFESARQGSNTITAYGDHLRKISLGLDVSEKHIINKFLRTLTDRSIYPALSTSSFPTLEAAVDGAERCASAVRSVRRPASTQDTRDPEKRSGTPTRDNRRCHICNKIGHVSANCPNKKRSDSKRGTPKSSNDADVDSEDDENEEYDEFCDDQTANAAEYDDSASDCSFEYPCCDIAHVNVDAAKRKDSLLNRRDAFRDTLKTRAKVTKSTKSNTSNATVGKPQWWLDTSGSDDKANGKPDKGKQPKRVRFSSPIPPNRDPSSSTKRASPPPRAAAVDPDVSMAPAPPISKQQTQHSKQHTTATQPSSRSQQNPRSESDSQTPNTSPPQPRAMFGVAPPRRPPAFPRTRGAPRKPSSQKVWDATVSLPLQVQIGLLCTAAEQPVEFMNSCIAVAKDVVNQAATAEEVQLENSYALHCDTLDLGNRNNVKPIFENCRYYANREHANSELTYVVQANGYHAAHKKQHLHEDNPTVKALEPVSSRAISEPFADIPDLVDDTVDKTLADSKLGILQTSCKTATVPITPGAQVNELEIDELAPTSKPLRETLYLPVHLDRQPTFALIDTGAQVSLITSELALHLGLVHPDAQNMQDTSVNIVGVNGATSPTTKIWVQLQISDEYKSNVRLYLIDSAAYKCIIGCDLLSHWRTWIDFDTRQLGIRRPIAARYELVGKTFVFNSQWYRDYRNALTQLPNRDKHRATTVGCVKSFDATSVDMIEAVEFAKSQRLICMIGSREQSFLGPELSQLIAGVDEAYPVDSNVGTMPKAVKVEVPWLTSTTPIDTEIASPIAWCTIRGLDPGPAGTLPLRVQKLSKAIAVNNRLLNPELTLPQRTSLLQILLEFAEVFAFDMSDITQQADFPPFVVETTGGPIRQKSYRLPRADLELVMKEVDSLKHLGMMEDSNSPWSSPTFVVRSANHRARMITDSRKVNAVTKKTATPSPIFSCCLID